MSRFALETIVKLPSFSLTCNSTTQKTCYGMVMQVVGSGAMPTAAQRLSQSAIFESEWRNWPRHYVVSAFAPATGLPKKSS
jgi:hypothetical protein